MDNLNKENFFDAAGRSFPLAMDSLLQFVDRYKLANTWDKLFNGGFFVQYTGPQKQFEVYTKAPKFHDIPLAMQVGIIIEWIEQLRENGYIGVPPAHYLIHSGLSFNAISVGLRIILSNLQLQLKSQIK